MKTRPLGRTGLELPWLSFGASSLGQEFRTVDLGEALRSVRVALDLGMNFIDTSPFYGRGMSECLLGVALRGVPRDSYLLGHQARPVRPGPLRLLGPAGRRERRRQPPPDGRRPPRHHALPRHRVRRDVARSSRRPCRPSGRSSEQGKVRFIGVSGYPMKMFRYVLDRTDLDVILSYNHYTLQNTMLADLVPVPEGEGRRHHERRAVLGPAADQRPAARPGTRRRPRSARSPRRPPSIARARGVDIAQLALQYSLANEDMTTCVVGSANPENVRKWAEWADMPIDQALLAEVLEILEPIHDWHYTEGRPENNDPPSEPGDLNRPTEGGRR